MRILYYANWNISQLSYFFPILTKYGGAIYCNNSNVINFIKNSTKYNKYRLFTSMKKCLLYNPQIIIYTQYPDYLRLPIIKNVVTVHVMIDHGPDYKYNAYSYNYNQRKIKLYDMIACSGKYDIDSYKLRNKKGKFELCGCPKTEIKPKKINIFPDRNKKVLLYAPTWSHNNGSISRMYKKIKDLSQYYYIFILPHSLLIENNDDKNTLITIIKEQTINMRIIARNPKMNLYYKKNAFSLYFDDMLDDCLPFINYADIVVTDMSSLIGETLMLNKPLYITEERQTLSKNLIEQRIKLNKTLILIDLPRKELRSFDRDYIFYNEKESPTDYIIQKSINLSKIKYTKIKYTKIFFISVISVIKMIKKRIKLIKKCIK